MITPKYVAAISSLCLSNFTLMLIPGVDVILVVALIFLVILISVAINLFFFWEPLREFLYKGLLSKFYLDLYTNDDFVDFLIEKRNSRKRARHTNVSE